MTFKCCIKEDSDIIANNIMNYKAVFIQALVENYLYDKYKNSSSVVYMYDEIINDIDIFDKPLPDNVLMNINTKNKYTIKTFLTILDDYDVNYLESIEVKHVERLLFKNIKQILLKSSYNNSTLLKLIFVPSNHDKQLNADAYNIIKCFSQLKTIMLSLDDESKTLLFNYILKTNHNDNKQLIVGLTDYINALFNHSINMDKQNYVDDTTYNIFVNNFINFNIEIITKQELLAIDFHKEIMHKIIDCPRTDDTNIYDLTDINEKYKTFMKNK